MAPGDRCTEQEYAVCQLIMNNTADLQLQIGDARVSSILHSREYSLTDNAITRPIFRFPIPLRIAESPQIL